MQSAERAERRVVCEPLDEALFAAGAALPVDCQALLEIFGPVPGLIEVRRAELVCVFWAEVPMAAGTDLSPYCERVAQEVEIIQQLQAAKGKQDFPNERQASLQPW